MASDAQLLGRVTYGGFAKAWPTMPDAGKYGEKMNARPKFVVSQTLNTPRHDILDTCVHSAVAEADLPRRAAELVAAQFDTVAAAAEGCDAPVATGVMPTGECR
jgi:hypothetical protein